MVSIEGEVTERGAWALPSSSLPESSLDGAWLKPPRLVMLAELSAALSPPAPYGPSEAPLAVAWLAAEGKLMLEMPPLA